MAAITRGSIDIEKPAKYPIVLSDALLGKTTKEVYTGIRYNHKPNSSSDSSQGSLHLQASDSDSTSYELSLKDNSDQYSYQGVRTLGNRQYVLIFDPAKKHFVLHRIDSTFDMNLVSAPWAHDAAKLRSQYPQLDTQVKPQATAPQKKASKVTKKAAAVKSEAPRRKAEKPKKAKPTPVVREPTPEAEDSDDGLTVEYPDAPVNYQYTSTPLFAREVSDEDEDAEGEEYDEEEERNQDVDHLKLPSPANNDAGGLSDEDMELDLEAELEQALNADESSESEEE